jgi:hypothetical protein
VARVTQASNRVDQRYCFIRLGKWRLRRSGKDTVNKTGEEFFALLPYHFGTVTYYFVMPGLVPGIHVLLRAASKTWMAGTSPAMTSFD